MTRTRPLELEFVDHDDRRLLAAMVEARATGTGWINVTPVIDEEYEPPRPGAVRLPGWVDPQGTHGHLDARAACSQRHRQGDHRGPPARVRAQSGGTAPRPRRSVTRWMADHPGPSAARPGRPGAGGRR